MVFGTTRVEAPRDSVWPKAIFHRSLGQRQADLVYSKAELDTAIGIHKDSPAAIAELRVTMQQQKYEALQAAVEQAVAGQKSAQFALTSAKEAIKATESQLDMANFTIMNNGRSVSPKLTFTHNTRVGKPQ